MAVRTYFWDTAQKTTKRRFGILPRKKEGWQVGNAGDIYNRDMVRHLYGADAINSDEGGKRILLVGSTVHRVQSGDIIAGVGTKGTAQPSASDAPARVVGVRGPITADALRDAGYDVSGIRFMLDPGLLIAQVFPELTKISPRSGSVGFVPHYRERPQYRDTKDYSIIEVDATPRDFARDIAKHEIIFSSSLHGVIFAHALGRPAVLVAPQTAEPEIKYRDYFASVGLDWSTPGDIDHELRNGKPLIPSALEEVIATADFPTLEELREAGVAT